MSGEVAAALAVNLTDVPLTVALAFGLVIDAVGGGTLLTVTLTGLDVVVWPAVSTARAVIAWVPSPAVVESQLNV